MKTIVRILLLLSCFTTLKAYAQDTTKYLKPVQVKLNLDFLGASVSYEQRVSNSNTLYLDAGIGYGFTYQSTYFDDANNTYYQYQVRPAITAEFRHYYHFKERLAKSRSIANNGSNFFAMNVDYIFKPSSSTTDLDKSAVVSIMPSWGIQRALGNSFSFELQLGVQFSYELTRYTPNSTQWTVGPGTVIRIGYVLH